jgi:nucleoside-diphosphate-sugar epimerase
MRVFVTGASGFIGSAVVADLLAAGHRVLGLARSDASARTLEAAGADVHRGSLEDLDSLRHGASLADGVIHTAFIHDFTRFAANCETDRLAIEAMGAALAGSNRPLVVTSGLAMLAPGTLALESHRHGEHFPRKSEQAADAACRQGVKAITVRLSPSVHGRGDHGFVPMLIGLARQKGVAAYIGDGQNRWPAVHRTDAARLFRLALEQGEAGGRYHGVAEQGVPFRTIAETIGRGLDVPVLSMTPEEAQAHFGWMALFAGTDCPTSSEWTRGRLGWQPGGPGLLDDMAHAGYFDH